MNDRRRGALIGLAVSNTQLAVTWVAPTSTGGVEGVIRDASISIGIMEANISRSRLSGGLAQFLGVND